MNDEFPGLTPPPARALTPEQRSRIRATLPLDHPDEHRRLWWVTGAAAAAAVVLVIGAAVGISRSVGGSGVPRQVGPAGHSSPPLPEPSAACSGDGCAHTTGPGVPANSLRISSSAGEMCVERAPRTLVLFGQATPIRDVVMTGAELEDARGAVLGRTWVSVKPVNDVASAGAFQEGLPGMGKKLERMWRSRHALAGAHLTKGVTYTFFSEITVQTGGHASGIGYAYTDDMSPGISVIPSGLHTAARCP